MKNEFCTFKAVLLEQGLVALNERLDFTAEINLLHLTCQELTCIPSEQENTDF